jgi:hypothetical protein
MPRSTARPHSSRMQMCKNVREQPPARSVPTLLSQLTIFPSDYDHTIISDLILAPGTEHQAPAVTTVQSGDIIARQFECTASGIRCRCAVDPDAHDAWCDRCRWWQGRCPCPTCDPYGGTANYVSSQANDAAYATSEGFQDVRSDLHYSKTCSMRADLEDQVVRALL